MSAELYREDLSWAIRRLPKALVALMKERPNQLVVAGGFIRSVIANEKIQDVDVFSPNKDCACACAVALAGDNTKIIETDNAYTVPARPFSTQFIHRWVFEKPLDVVPSFDFTIAGAAFWWNGEVWESFCNDRFYADLASKRLVYCAPKRNEDAGGSLLRVLKFYQRGYRIPLDSMGAVIARLMTGVRLDEVGTEEQMAKVVTGLLREVDPNVDPTHEAHLPSLTPEAGSEK